MIAKELGGGIGWFHFNEFVRELLLGRWWSLQVEVDLDWTFLEQGLMVVWDALEIRMFPPLLLRVWDGHLHLWELCVLRGQMPQSFCILVQG